MKSVQIYVGYHKPYQILKSKIFVPLHLGRSVATKDSKDGLNSSDDLAWLEKNMIGDDTGDNISAKNRYYNELTGIYWLWKNYDKIGSPDSIGMMQYRRHFIFKDSVFRNYEPMEYHEKPYAKINVGNMYNGYIEHFGLDDKTVHSVVDKYDAILPVECDMSSVDAKTIREDYDKLIPGTRVSDLDILVDVVDELYPKYGSILRKRLGQPKKRCYQSFVLKKEVFFDYCKFLFKILFAVEKKLDLANYTINGQRTLGYMGEILFDTYMSSLVDSKKYKVKELGTTYLAEKSIPKPIKPRTAIVQLAYADYESLEISLANFCHFLDDDTKLFILQNGRGTYDTERTYRTAKRYESLYPDNIVVVDDIRPQRPYLALRELFNSERLKQYDYICKVDDDVFPLSSDWFDRLCETYEQQFALHGESLAYASALVNNNPFGFKQIIERNKELHDEYFGKMARPHMAGTGGPGEYYPGRHHVPADDIDDDVCGTVWQLPYISRWLHQKTTLQPDKYLDMTKSWPTVEVRNKRYSINIMLFDKDLWNRIEDENSYYPDDDEFLCQLYCRKTGRYVAVDLSNPFAHLFFYSQREENKDLIPAIRDLYQDRLNQPYPIALQADRLIENENRLRYIENESRSRDNQQINIISEQAKTNQNYIESKKLKLRTRIKNNEVAQKAWMILPNGVRQSIKHNYRKLRGLE